MTKKQLKHYAQDELLFAMGVAFVRLSDDTDMTEDEREAARKEMSKQMERVEKLFGYEPGSFSRGV